MQPDERPNGQTVDRLVLGAIAQAHTWAIRAGATQKLRHVQPRLRELPQLTKLDRFLPLTDSEDA